MSDLQERPIARAVLECWVQTSSDYNATKHFATCDIYKETTVSDLLAWKKTMHCQQFGQIIISELAP